MLNRNDAHQALPAPIPLPGGLAMPAPGYAPVNEGPPTEDENARFWQYRVMDLIPNEAIAAGWLREGSPAGRALQYVSHETLRRASKVIALDRFMRVRLLKKGADPDSVEVIAPWSHDDALSYDLEGRVRFRARHGLEDR